MAKPNIRNHDHCLFQVGLSISIYFWRKVNNSWSFELKIIVKITFYQQNRSPPWCQSVPVWLLGLLLWSCLVFTQWTKSVSKFLFHTLKFIEFQCQCLIIIIIRVSAGFMKVHLRDQYVTMFLNVNVKEKFN